MKIVNYSLLCLTLLTSGLSKGNEINKFHILEINAVYLDYLQVARGTEPFLAPSYHPKEKLDLHVDLDIANGWLFFNNMVHSETDAAQYRLIGWNYRIGVHIFRSADIFMEHYSQHLLDYAPSMDNNYDALGIRLYFFRKE